MSKNKSYTAAELQGMLNEIALRGTAESGLTFEQVMEQLENAPKGELVSLSAEYFTPKEGESYSMMVTGFTTMNKDGEDIEVVCLTDKLKNQWIAGQTVIVRQCKRLENLPAFIKITHKGMRGEGKNQYMNLEIETFRS